MTDNLRLEINGPVATLTLNRPERHNAFDAALIAALSDAFVKLASMREVRVVMMKGEGPSFCAGGDINWMKDSAKFTPAENRADTQKLADMLYQWATLPQATIAVVRGNTFGGGVGLVAGADVALADDAAVFCLPEAKLGLIAAVISPYVVASLGARQARRLLVTAERFSAEVAKRHGLIHEAVPGEELDSYADSFARDILKNSPQAIATLKKLLHEIEHRPFDRSLVDLTAQRLAEARTSEDGQEGLDAFLAKRKPRWVA